MKRVRLAQARAKVLTDLQRHTQRVRAITDDPVNSVEQGITVLQRLRSEAYEDLNQIQHEYAALLAIEWLQPAVGRDVVWYWNPRASGTGDEPDVRAVRGQEIVVSGEVTTSLAPLGVLDTRMRKTLEKLARLPGRQYYFVATNKMAQRARTKVVRNGWDIEVVVLDAPVFVPPNE